MCNKMIKTSNGNSHKGFYESCKENYMKQLLNIRSNNPDAESKTYYSTEFFLHGICHIFAYDLHQKFGYDILELENKSGGMTHWCCVSDYKGKKLYTLEISKSFSNGSNTVTYKMLVGFYEIESGIVASIRIGDIGYTKFNYAGYEFLANIFDGAKVS